MKKVPVIILIFFTCNLTLLFGQGEIDDQEKTFFRNERTFAAIISTDGYGAGFRYAKRLDAFRKSIYEAEFSYVRDEEETKVSPYSSQQLNSSFVPGKINAFFTLRGGIGYQKEIFQKRDKGGISIRYFYNFGPVIGILKPIYYEIAINADTTISKKLKREEFNSSNINGRSPFYKGIDEISIVPGAYGKFGFTFEFSKHDKSFSAIETGIALNVFTKKPRIMDDNDNNFAFFTFFLSYRFGKIIDAQFGNKLNKVDEIISK
jgi:hypothetical protein